MGRELEGHKSGISIHALLAESDNKEGSHVNGCKKNFYPRSPCGERLLGAKRRPCMGRISIHALLAESDYNKVNLKSKSRGFLSTLSLRRATAADISTRRGASISIHALLAESERRVAMSTDAKRISIHALLAESDGAVLQVRLPLNDFYPRSPCGERVAQGADSWHQMNFYPRSPCGERTRYLISARYTSNFYPRSPCGERRL